MAAETLEETYLVNVESGVNANKYYRAILRTDGSIQTNWGRVGATGQSQLKQGGRSAYDSLIRAKLKKGYSPVEVLASASSARTTVDKTRLKEAATASLAGGATDPVLTALIERLVAANKHQLLEASGGMISVDVSGQVTTPLGIISAQALRDARDVLDTMSGLPAGDQRARLTEQYLRLVPQKVSVSAGRGWAAGWLDTLTSLQKQTALLDGLEASVSYADTARKNALKAAEAAGNEKAIPDDLFRYRVVALDPSHPDYQMVVERYTKTRQDVHTHVRHLKVARVFALQDMRHGEEIRKNHESLRNVQRLWHGTGVANVLSIMQKGLFVPPTRGSGIHIAGRMFGDGVYLSRSASKSLSYSAGFWGGSGGGRESKFMFLTQTAMGNEYRPAAGYDSQTATKARTRKDEKGNSFNSINVLPGMGGVRNHEAIVWDPMQVALSWLVEFEG